jgi:hypothetical protein
MLDLAIIEDTDMTGEPPLPCQLLEPLATRVAIQQDLLAAKDAAATLALTYALPTRHAYTSPLPHMREHNTSPHMCTHTMHLLRVWRFPCPPSHEHE